MDVLMFYPFIIQKGGTDRLLLQIAKKFDPIIYTSYYKPNASFKELKEFDIRIFRNPFIEATFSIVNDEVKRNLIISGAKSLFHKVKEDYDVILSLSPTHWIRNRNERVCWYFGGPIRSAFDLYSVKVSNLFLPKKLALDTMFWFYKMIEKRIDPKIEMVVTFSPYVLERDAEFIMNYIKRPIDMIVPAPVEEKEFRNESYDKYFFYPSRIAPEKRFEYVIEAFRQFSRKKKGWKLIIAGSLLQRKRELDYADKLKKLAEGLNVEFRFSISDDELKSLYANCFTVLFSPINEDWGYIPLEAMASEKPCISLNEGGPKYSIIDGKTGFLVNSPEEMADRMLYLAENPAEVERMGKEGRKEVLRKYTWKKFANDMEKALKKVSREKYK